MLHPYVGGVQITRRIDGGLTMPLDTVAGFSSPSCSAADRAPMRPAAAILRGNMAPAPLAAADVVFYESDIDPAVLVSVPRNAWVERVPAANEDAAAQSAAIVRARRLAADGWRVVWLAASDTTDPALDFAGAGPAADEHRMTVGVTAMFDPRLLATALNGLAG
jgi:hypothetical protein